MWCWSTVPGPEGRQLDSCWSVLTHHVVKSGFDGLSPFCLAWLQPYLLPGRQGPFYQAELHAMDLLDISECVSDQQCCVTCSPPGAFVFGFLFSWL